MTLVVGCALMATVGLVLAARAAFPARPSLSRRLDDLLAPARPSPASPPSAALFGGLSEALWAAIDPEGQRFPALSEDLAIMGRRPAFLLRQMAMAATALGVVAAAVGLVLGAVGLAVAPGIATWAVLLAAAGGAVAPLPSLRVDAGKRRSEMRDAVAVVCDLAAVLVAAGEDLDGALVEATGVGAGWAFDALRQALAAASVSRQGPWVALGELGDRMRVEELVALAQNTALAGQEGAKIRDALATQAKALRDQATADVRAKAGSVTERMSFPMVLLLVGFILVIGYPATSRL